MTFIIQGFRAMLPITTGLIPFGAVMGTVCAEAGLSLYQSVMMNVLVFAGASQLAAVELMTKDTASLVVIVTGLIINLRFLLYSAALSPVVQRASPLVKLASAYSLTDHTYAVMTANQERLSGAKQSILFYLGAALCMMLAWHLAVVAGFVFGNFAPASWSLDYAVPLSFVALVVPTLKNSKYLMVVACSGACSLAFSFMPFKTGVIVTALVAISFAAWLTQKRGAV